MVVAFTLAVCKDMQSPTNDKLIFVLVNVSRFSYAISTAKQASLMKLYSFLYVLLSTDVPL